MHCCDCASVRDLGCFGHCDAVSLDGTAPLTGEYQIRRDFLGTRRVSVQTFNAGDPLALAFPRNEAARVTFQLVLPDFSIYTDADGHDCFTFRSRPGMDA